MVEMIKIANTEDVQEGSAIAVEVAGEKIALFNVEGSYYAIDDTCTHRGGPLCEGEVEGTEVTCPWHGATFDLTNGSVLSPPAPDGVASYKVVVEENEIKIEIP
jgi:nitrite reductase/ring-hydroxylating ferredoxin subunit